MLHLLYRQDILEIMAYFNELERLVINKIIETEPAQMKVLGELLIRDLFKANELALFVMAKAEQDFECLVFAQNNDAFKSQFEHLVSVMAFIKKLEESRLVYVVSMPSQSLFYEYVCANALYDKGNSAILLQKGQCLKADNKRRPYIYDKSGKCILSPYSLSPELNRDLVHSFCSLIYATLELKEFVRNGYKTGDELQHEEIMENANNQLKKSTCAVRWAIVSVIISFITLLIAFTTLLVTWLN